jgi:undecaprenyl-diphosphatase
LNLNWFESVLYGLFSGLTDIVPVSSQVHKTLMLKIFGIKGHMEVMDLLVHLAIAAALYSSCRNDLNRMTRAKALSRIPKKKRKRPLDTKSLMDYSLWKTMLLPVILSFFLYEKVQALESQLVWVSVFVLLNGLILYIPQFFPSSNKDSRTLSRVEGLVVGVGGALAIFPGMSGMGAGLSLAGLCGMERPARTVLLLYVKVSVKSIRKMQNCELFIRIHIKK